MANNSDVLHPIQEAPLLFKRMFKRELEFFDMLEMLPLILRQTGSIATETYLFQGTTLDFCLDLPCNVFTIESVSHQLAIEHYHGFISTPQNVLINYNNPNLQDEEVASDVTAIVYQMNGQVVTRPVGALIDFKVVGKNLSVHVNYNNLPVDIIYVGTVVDEEGYPMVPYKTLVAIVNYMNYLNMKAAYYSKQIDHNMYQEAKQDMTSAIANARTPDWMNQNQTNELLTILTSSNRKKHNRSFRG